MSFSTVLIRNSDDVSAREFSSLRTNKTMMKGVENKVNMRGVGNMSNNIIAMKILMQGKPDQAKSKTTKKLCMCSPTNHPGSFRCRYHRPTSVPKVNNNSPHPAATEHLKLRSMKPPLSRFSKAPVVASELPR